MALKNHREFRLYFLSRFRGILDLTIRNGLKTPNPVPTWGSNAIPGIVERNGSGAAPEDQAPEAAAASGTPGP